MQSKLMTIGEVAARLGRSVDFVRDETDAGRLKAEPRGQKGHRKYREAAVILYESRNPGRSGSTAARPAPPAPPRQAVGRRPPLPPPEDEWDADTEDVDDSVPTAKERTYLHGLVVSAMREAPSDLPPEWRLKLQTELEDYVTFDRFPDPDGASTAMQMIRLRVEALVHAYNEAKKKDAERERARVIAEFSGPARVRELIAYGKKLLELALSKWERDDPTTDARTEVETVLAAEVKADWTEGQVRDLVNEVLEEYEEDGEEDDDEDDEEEEVQGDDVGY